MSKTIDVDWSFEYEAALGDRIMEVISGLDREGKLRVLRAVTAFVETAEGRE